MKNTFGNNLTVTIYGESHGEAIGVVMDGLPGGLEVKRDVIDEALARRRPSSSTDTSRVEPDEYRLLSGVYNGYTTGTPICIEIPNTNTKSKDYQFGPARPSHADYTAHVKYKGFEDYRGGGHFSGRITAGLVAAGAILTPALSAKGITIGTHIKKCCGIKDVPLIPEKNALDALKNKHFPVFDDAKGQMMTDGILKAKEDNDSVGGITETAIIGLKAGLGEPWFDSVESMLSHGLFSIGGIKGVEFGAGFAFSNMRGSEANDPFMMDGDRIITATNNNGGINGGITNGMPIILSCAIKPTPSIAREQDTIDFIKNENTKLNIHGRHDPAIIRRICPVIDAVCAITVSDMLVTHSGTDGLL